ncbi:MAG: hypothetical protein ABR505_07490 [Actinomycetota bacterium]
MLPYREREVPSAEGRSNLTRGQKMRRAIATLGGVLSLVLGTAVGLDDHFPWGPFRMYSTTTTDRVTVLLFEGVTTDGREVSLASSAFGLRPAEMHGQIAQFEPDLEELLARLVASYASRHPTEEPLARLELSYGVHVLEEGRSVDYREQVLAAWTG